MISFIICTIGVALSLIAALVAAIFGHAVEDNQVPQDRGDLGILFGLWVICFTSGITLLLIA